MHRYNRRALAVLGSTGSIGRQTLSVARDLGLAVDVLAANRSAAEMEAQARLFLPRMAILADEKAAAALKIALADTPVAVYGGKEALAFAAAETKADTLVAAMVGMAGLAPVLAAIAAGKDVALANKEVLVCAGKLVMQAAQEKNIRILPVDSEHSAIFQCLAALPPEERPEKLILTASGGPFFGRTRKEMADITPEQALAHPNWRMGPKISIDSATMMNKGLELIEAMWLFSVQPADIDIVVHRESIVHSLVQTADGAVLAQLGLPDMRQPIQFALTAPYHVKTHWPRLDFTAVGALHFAKPDESAFPALALAKRAAAEGGALPVALNAANEGAVARFLAGEIGFLAIAETVCRVMDAFAGQKAESLEEIYAIDQAARNMAEG